MLSAEVELDLRMSRGFHGCVPLDQGVAAHCDLFEVEFNGIMKAVPACGPQACAPEDGARVLRCHGHSSRTVPGIVGSGLQKCDRHPTNGPC